MERILCNTSPTISKIASLLGHRLTAIGNEHRGGKITMVAKLDGNKMTMRDIESTLRAEVKQRGVQFVNHSNHVLTVEWL